jgi:hypothetical protein
MIQIWQSALVVAGIALGMLAAVLLIEAWNASPRFVASAAVCILVPAGLVVLAGVVSPP